MATIVLVPSLAKEIEDLTVGTSRACSNRGNEDDKHSCYKPTTIVERVYAKIQPIYNGCGLW